ncbi:universal stress protein [Aquabacterium humicola]|uniref:universal stress protein n=1 Tax=Aquabacterium humicola TaxID=3237377 RepID=UPI00254356B9|nr:universal stress protein [Rubrivivax pictus]
MGLPSPDVLPPASAAASPIVVATDFSAHARHAAWRAALQARAVGAPLALVHTVTGSALSDLRRGLPGGEEAVRALEDDARAQLQSAADAVAQRHGVAVQQHLTFGHPVEQVPRLAEELQAMLVVTGTRGAGFSRGVVIGATAERIAKRTAIPVLMVRQQPHEPYRRVLVPVDLSPWSVGAITLARRVAPGAPLVLLHVIQVPYEGRMRLAGVADDAVQRYRENARQEAGQRLAGLAREAGLRADEHTVSIAADADPWMMIVRAEVEHDCDLVVMGRQGRHALEELMLGSTTRMVSAEGTADLLISIHRST